MPFDAQSYRAAIQLFRPPSITLWYYASFMVDLIESRVLRQIVSYCFGQNAPMQLERQNNNNRVEDTPDDTTRVAFSSEKWRQPTR